MKLYGVRIWVTDLEEAKRFYSETLGLTKAWEFEGAAIGFDLGGPQFIIEPDNGVEEESHVGRFVGASISVDDIDAAYRDLTARGVVFLGPPEKMYWGGTLAHFEDPSGNTLTLLG